MPLSEEPECIINELNLYSKIKQSTTLTILSYSRQPHDSLSLYI